MKRIYLEVKYEKGNAIKGYILDLSQTGMGIACSRIINKNTIIEIKTEKNVLSPVIGKIVSVVYRQKKTYGYRLGVKFISLKKEKNKKLVELIRRAENRETVRLNLI